MTNIPHLKLQLQHWQWKLALRLSEDEGKELAKNPRK
jgi:hypothetical protein